MVGLNLGLRGRRLPHSSADDDSSGAHYHASATNDVSAHHSHASADDGNASASCWFRIISNSVWLLFCQALTTVTHPPTTPTHPVTTRNTPPTTAGTSTSAPDPQVMMAGFRPHPLEIALNNSADLTSNEIIPDPAMIRHVRKKIIGTWRTGIWGQVESSFDCRLVSIPDGFFFSLFSVRPAATAERGLGPFHATTCYPARKRMSPIAINPNPSRRKRARHRPALSGFRTSGPPAPKRAEK